jgi:ABC-2 type transport system ATP-binding protein
MPAFVSVQQLTKRYGDLEAVRSVSFDLAQGEIFGLLGPNGAGKTSILECLTGLREPDSGHITIAGHDARRNPRALKEKIGVVLQSTALQDNITPREALTLFGSFYRRALPAHELLARFNLTAQADARAHTLSGGQRQRLALALAFVNEPEFILLDEPTAALDPATRRALHTDILRWRDEGRTVLLSTHYLEEAEQLCDRVAIIDRGQVLATGTPRELVTASAGHAIVRLVTNPVLSIESLAQLPGFVADPHNSPQQFVTTDPTATLAAIPTLLAAHRATVTELQIKPASLEDFFLGLVGNDQPKSPTS